MTSHIVVIGAGYSGLLTAKLTAKRTGARVTLVNERDRFVERVRLHQLAAGQELEDLPITGLLEGSSAAFRQGRVTKIDPGTRTVTLDEGEPLTYDILVYALGSTADFESVPGVAEHAFTVASAEQAAALRERLKTSGAVVVVGGGLTGIEAATEIAETKPGLKVKLVTGGVFGEALSEKGRKHLRKVFGRLGIGIVDNAIVKEVSAAGVLLADEEHLEADTVVWTTGFRVPELARAAGLECDASGRLVVDETLRSVSHPDVYGVGDAAAAHMKTGQKLRMACATGLPSAMQLARSISGALEGKPGKPLRFRYFNQCISLGRRDALVQFVRADDSPVSAVLTGRFAARYKETIVRSTVWAQRHPVLAAAVLP
ncbi:FAD-dependent oxidoreductase [Saccharomonospora sp. NPDC006951]